MVSTNASSFDGTASSRAASFGRGRPGWHLECSAMALAFIGERYGAKVLDIHTGGVEHIGVHHNNEIAQSECATGKHPMSRFWMHREHIRMNDAKIAKSTGNTAYLSDVLAHGETGLRDERERQALAALFADTVAVGVEFLQHFLLSGLASGLSVAATALTKEITENIAKGFEDITHVVELMPAHAAGPIHTLVAKLVVALARGRIA